MLRILISDFFYGYFRYFLLRAALRTLRYSWLLVLILIVLLIKG